jgi:hypothetical protein
VRAHVLSMSTATVRNRDGFQTLVTVQSTLHVGRTKVGVTSLPTVAPVRLAIISNSTAPTEAAYQVHVSLN